MTLNELVSKKSQAIANREAAYNKMNENIKNAEVFAEAKREFEKFDAEAGMLADAIKSQRETVAAPKSANAMLREFLKNGKSGETFTLHRSYTGIHESDLNGGSVGLTINDVIPAKSYGLIYDKVGCPIQTNVQGDIQWPYAGYVEAEIQGEDASASDNTISLNKYTAVQNRLTIRIKVSNKAINDVDYDLQSFVAQQAQRAIYYKLNHALASQAQVAPSFYGPFANTGVQTLQYKKADGFTFANAMKAVGMVYDNAEHGEVAHVGFVMSPTKYYELKATPRDAGSGLMIIDDNGMLGGFPVAVTSDINWGITASSTTGKRGTSKLSVDCIGCGDFSKLAINQHGEIRVSLDRTSSEAAKEDVTIVTINSYWSLTNLDPKAFVKITDDGE